MSKNTALAHDNHSDIFSGTAKSTRKDVSSSTTDFSKIGDLTKAIMDNDITQVKVLLDQISDPNQPDAYGLTPLLTAIEGNNVEITELLLAHPLIDPNTPDISGYDALTYAIHSNQEAILRLLISNKTTLISKPDQNGYTPFDWAMYLENTKFVQILIAEKIYRQEDFSHAEIVLLPTMESDVLDGIAKELATKLMERGMPVDSEGAELEKADFISLYDTPQITSIILSSIQTLNTSDLAATELHLDSEPSALTSGEPITLESEGTSPVDSPKSSPEHKSISPLSGKTDSENQSLQIMNQLQEIFPSLTIKALGKGKTLETADKATIGVKEIENDSHDPEFIIVASNDLHAAKAYIAEAIKALFPEALENPEKPLMFKITLSSLPALEKIDFSDEDDSSTSDAYESPLESTSPQLSGDNPLTDYVTA